MDDGQRRTQLVRDVGDEVAAHLLELHDPGDVAGEQQPQIFGVGNQPQLQTRARGMRRRDVEHRLGAAPLRQPVRDRQRLQHVAHRLAHIARHLQSQQAGRRAVEPLDALAVALHDDHRIGQRRRHGAIRAQHRDETPLARAHVLLSPVQHAIGLLPHTIALRRRHAAARGQSRQQVVELPVVPGQHT